MSMLERTDGAQFSPWSSSNARAIVYMTETRIESGHTIEGEELRTYKVSNKWLQEAHAAAAKTELIAGLGLNVAARLIGNRGIRRLTHFAGAVLLADSTRNFLESETRKAVAETVNGMNKIDIVQLQAQVPSFS